MKPRLFYLDNLKAFAILAVIASHVNSFVFSNGGCFMNKVIDTFFMGTFFLVSGYLGYRAFTEKVSLRKFFEAKTYNLLIPLFVVGTVYVLCRDLAANGRITVNPLLKMITNGYQMGYWFLLTLFVFRIMALVTGVITNGEVLKRHQVIHCAVQLPVYCAVGGLICIAKMVSSGNELWHNCFSDHLLYYMLFYYGGALLRRLQLLPRLQRSDALMAASFATGITLCVAYHVAGLSHPLMLITLYRMCIVVPIFVYFSKFIDKPILCFTTLGIHSLELYVLHYFVIIGCSDYSAIWIEGIKEMPFLFQLMLNGGVTAVIATVTMLIARVANHNAVIKKFVLGKF